MKTINVVAAIICDSLDTPTEFFATERGYGDQQGGWEFPGGKIEQGETPQQALIREIYEELETEIVVGPMLQTIEYDYPAFHLSMKCYLATVKSGKLELKEAADSSWLTAETLDDVNWLPADRILLPVLKALLVKT